MKRKKRVFRIYKFLQTIFEAQESLRLPHNEEIISAFEAGWPQMCEGKTVKECAKMDFIIHLDWTVLE